MSHVTDVVVMFTHDEDTIARQNELNAWAAHGHPFGKGLWLGQFAEVSRHAGGSKAAQLVVLQMASHAIASIPVLLSFLQNGVGWKDRSGVFVAILDEGDEQPIVLRLDTPTLVAIARELWPADWDFFYHEDGSERTHTDREVDRFHEHGERYPT